MSTLQLQEGRKGIVQILQESIFGNMAVVQQRYYNPSVSKVLFTG